MKYIALKDLPPNVKAGDVVEINDKLLPELEEYFKVTGEDAVVTKSEEDDAGTQFVGNPSREELKARATTLDIVFAPNIPTAKLVELIEEAEAKAASEQGGEDNDDADGDKKSEDEE